MPATEPAAHPAPHPATAYGPPLRPRRGLAFGLLGAFGVWTAVLWGMYFATVRPRAHVGSEGAMPPAESVAVPR